MNEIKSLEKLHEIAYEMRNIGASSMTPRELFAFWAMDIEKAAGEIQVEIDSRYMELPIDADGVPIHVGDFVQFRNDAPVTVDSIGTSKVYENDFGFFGSNGGFYGQGTLKNTRHVKPRTLENLLEELVRCASFPGEPLDRGDIEGFADEIRELLGSDA